MEKVTTIAVIQARMGSTRFPGKVLKHLRGKPVLWHIVYRLKKSKRIDKIIIATSDNQTDNAIEVFCRQEKLNCIRGSESDVLGRFELAIKEFDSDYIVRVTGDAPLIDSLMIDSLLGTIITQKSDYCTGEPGVPCIHEGFDVFSKKALEKILSKYRNDPIAREHVTGFIKTNPELFNISYILIDKIYQFENARVSVDSPHDLEFLETIYKHLDVPAGEIDIVDVVKLLKSKPELLEINSHVYQKKATELSHHVIIRCDGSSRVGLGHVFRCLALAEMLRDSYGWGVTFALVEGNEGVRIIKKANYHLESKSNEDEKEALWLDRLIALKKPDVLILDIRTNLSKDQIIKWRSNGLLTVAIDDPSERRLAVDLAFYPPVPQVNQVDWGGFTGKLYTGFEYVIMRKEFSKKYPRPQNRIPKVLVTMGGSDPEGLTFKVVESLELLKESFKPIVVVGAAFTEKEKFIECIKRSSKQYDIMFNVKNMAELMKDINIAVASFGMTAYELAAVGVPSIYMCLTEDHEKSASLFTENNIGINLGLYTNASKELIAEKVKELLTNKKLYKEIEDNLERIECGFGAKQIASIITKKVTYGK